MSSGLAPYDPQLPVLLLCALNLLYIAALPRIFFRAGALNVQWWLTALPFAAAGAAVVIGALGGNSAISAAGAVGAAGADPQSWRGVSAVALAAQAPLPALLQLAAVPLAAASMGLISFTLGTHRRPVSLWHQQDDAPDELVTAGAYARIRHPFYAAFLLCLGACVIAAPGALALAALAAAALQLRRTARREERRLLAGSFGAEYAEYMTRTGRFLPRLVRAYSSGSTPERT